jgi:hypothetical protein
VAKGRLLPTVVAEARAISFLRGGCCFTDPSALARMTCDCLGGQPKNLPIDEGFRVPLLTLYCLGGGGGCGLGQGVGGLGWPRAGVDGLWHLCCGVFVGGPFAGGRPSVFQHSQLLLVRWGDAWGCGGGRAAAWASSGRGQLQQTCGFATV